jgi:hypothetical protein
MLEAVDEASLRREQSELRKRLDLIDARLKAERGPAPEERERERGVTVTVSVAQTGFQRPTAEQLLALSEIVWREHAWLDQCSEAAFERAFLGVGYMYRLDEPSRKLAFYSHVDNCNDVLQRLGLRAVEGAAVLAAILAHGDIPWRAHNPRRGQMLEVALAPFTGRKCNNRWRAVLTGEPLLPSLPSRYS